MQRNNFSLFAVFLGLLLGSSCSIHPKIPIFLIACILLVIFIKKKVVFFYLIPLSVIFLIISLFNKGIEGFNSLNGIVLETKNNYFIFRSGFNKYYVYCKDCSYQIGDHLRITGNVKSLNFTTYESYFDFNNFLQLKGVNNQIKVKEISDIYLFPVRLRLMENSFLSKFDFETQSLLDSLLFSRKNYDSETINFANELGLLNLCSTSGLLFGFLLRFFDSILSIKLNEKTSYKITTFFSFLFLPFCLNKIGIIKVWIIRVLRIILGRNISYLNIISIAGIILLVFDHNLAVQTSFLLSFGVSLLLFFSSFLIKRVNQFYRYFYRYLLVQLFILPIGISYNNGLHLLTPLYSIILLPLIEIFTLIGVIFFITFPATKIMNFSGKIISLFLRVFSTADLVVPITVSSTFFYLYYLVFVICLLLHEIGDLHVRDLIAYFFLGTYFFSYVPLLNLVTQSVTFINVGQGDCCLIQDRFSSVMIDTGGSTKLDIATESLIPYLKNRRIYKIDYLIASHGDFDHIGAKDSLMKNFNVTHYIDSASSFPLKIGDIYLENYNNYGFSEENESSLVLGMNFIGYNWLFTGDATSTIEKKIIKDYPNIECDILKVGHHGSSSSTSYEFLKKIRPKEAVISVGASNMYGHPSDEILQRLKIFKVNIRRTDLEGTISYSKFCLSS